MRESAVMIGPLRQRHQRRRLDAGGGRDQIAPFSPACGFILAGALLLLSRLRIKVPALCKAPEEATHHPGGSAAF
jgi:hypothetical protein